MSFHAYDENITNRLKALDRAVLLQDCECNINGSVGIIEKGTRMYCLELSGYNHETHGCKITFHTYNESDEGSIFLFEKELDDYFVNDDTLRSLENEQKEIERTYSLPISVLRWTAMIAIMISAITMIVGTIAFLCKATTIRNNMFLTCMITAGLCFLCMGVSKFVDVAMLGKLEEKDNEIRDRAASLSVSEFIVDHNDTSAHKNYGRQYGAVTSKNA